MKRAISVIGTLMQLCCVLGCVGGKTSLLKDVSNDDTGGSAVSEESIVAPLSSKMHRLANRTLQESDLRSVAAIREFEDLLVQSQVGVIAELSEDTDQVLSEDLAYSCGPNGEKWLQIYADPYVFIQNYGNKFQISATMLGADAIRTVLLDPDADGLQINNALAERSMVLDRESLTALADRIRLRDQQPINRRD